MSPGEKAAAMAKDPVPAFRQRLISGGKATEAVLAGIEAEIAVQIDDAEQFAFASPFPGALELETDVYAERSV